MGGTCRARGMARSAPKRVRDATPAPPRSRHFIGVGDVVKIERRYVVDGSLTSVQDEGRFQGIQLLGTMEHIVLDAKGETRTIPLASISEITLVAAAPRPLETTDPSFG